MIERMRVQEQKERSLREQKLNDTETESSDSGEDDKQNWAQEIARFKRSIDQNVLTKGPSIRKLGSEQEAF